jgi:hypothetical protein
VNENGPGLKEISFLICSFNRSLGNKNRNLKKNYAGVPENHYSTTKPMEVEERSGNLGKIFHVFFLPNYYRIFQVKVRKAPHDDR